MYINLQLKIMVAKRAQALQLRKKKKQATMQMGKLQAWIEHLLFIFVWFIYLFIFLMI